jgi:hypothetical protein
VAGRDLDAAGTRHRRHETRCPSWLSRTAEIRTPPCTRLMT